MIGNMDMHVNQPSGPGELSAAPGAGPWTNAMDLALALAARAGAAGDVPVGAAVLDAAGEVLGSGYNSRETSHDPTAHAEILALRAAGQARGQWRLDGCSLVVTLEPCAMCAGAAIAARVDRIVFAAWDAKAGACGSVWDLPRDRAALHHPAVVAGVRAEEAAALLADFFAARRDREG
jgi:tRNA(adenine34) deaminase